MATHPQSDCQKKTGFLPIVIQMWNGQQDVLSRNVAHQWFRWFTEDFEAWLEKVAAQRTESVTQSSKSKLWAPNWRIHDVIEKLLWPRPVLCWCTWLLTPFMNWSQRWRRAQICAQSSIWKVATKWEFSDNHFNIFEGFDNTRTHLCPCKQITCIFEILSEGGGLKVAW